MNEIRMTFSIPTCHHHGEQTSWSIGNVPPTTGQYTASFGFFAQDSVAVRSTHICSARTSRHVSKAKPILGDSIKIRPYNEAWLIVDIEQWYQLLLLKAFELSPNETFAAFDAVRYTFGMPWTVDILEDISISWHQPPRNVEFPRTSRHYGRDNT